eukprot:10583878-Alexandrium_andersonii.AAC.1
MAAPAAAAGACGMGVGLALGAARLFLQHAGWRLLWGALTWLVDALVPAVEVSTQGAQPLETRPGEA